MQSKKIFIFILILTIVFSNFIIVFADGNIRLNDNLYPMVLPSDNSCITEYGEPLAYIVDSVPFHYVLPNGDIAEYMAHYYYVFFEENENYFITKSSPNENKEIYEFNLTSDSEKPKLFTWNNYDVKLDYYDMNITPLMYKHDSYTLCRASKQFEPSQGYTYTSNAYFHVLRPDKFQFVCNGETIGNSSIHEGNLGESAHWGEQITGNLPVLVSFLVSLISIFLLLVISLKVLRIFLPF